MDELFEEQRNEPSDVSAEILIRLKSRIETMAWKSPPKHSHLCEHGEVIGQDLAQLGMQSFE